MPDFTHFNDQGRAKMVNVGEKPVSVRTAVAGARVLVNPQTFALIKSGGMKKGDVLTVAQIAGVMGAKRTPDLIPMCHPILIDGIKLRLKQPYSLLVTVIGGLILVVFLSACGLRHLAKEFRVLRIKGINLTLQIGCFLL